MSEGHKRISEELCSTHNAIVAYCALERIDLFLKLTSKEYVLGKNNHVYILKNISYHNQAMKTINTSQSISQQPIAIIIEARKRIGLYCMNECKAKCCRMGRLLLTSPKQIRTISKGKMRRLYGQNVLSKRSDGEADLVLHPFGCPALSPQNKCSIFTSKQRPRICDEFPIFLRAKTVLFASSCPAVNEGMFEKEIKQLKQQGLRVIVQ
ncbi:MAG: YkgJ family cysteine cluster protein [Nanoarchaeota archaeon]